MVRNIRHRVTRRYQNILETRKGVNALILTCMVMVALFIIGIDLLALHPVGKPSLAVVAPKDRKTEHARYTCADGKSIDAQYDSRFDRKMAKLNLSDGRAFTLGKVMSVGPDQYANVSRSIIFTTSSAGASIDEETVMTYHDCVVVQ